MRSALARSAFATVGPDEELLARRRPSGPAPDAESLARDRRQFSRRRERELEWVHTVRLRSGGDVSLIDLSAGGALIDAGVPLRPGTLLSLEIIGHGLEAVVPLRVVRSQISALMPDGARYRGACAFARPLELPGVHPSDLPATSGDLFVGLDAALNRLVERAYSRDHADRLAPGDVLLVLQSLARRAGGADDPLGGLVGNLLQNLLPLLRDERRLQDVLRAIERQVAQSVPEMRVRMADTTAAADTTSVLIAPPGSGGAGSVAIDVPSGAAIDAQQARLLRTTGRVIALVQRLHGAAAAPTASPAVAADRPTAPKAASAPLAPVRPGVAGIMQKVVARYAEGQLLKGYSPDFHGSKSQFTVWPSCDAAPHERVVVPLARLKAVFFVREFGGDPDYVEQKVFESAGHGRRIEVTLLDGEVLVGTTLNYGTGGTGFFIVPADPRTNNERVFIVASAVRQVRFP